MRHHHLRSAPSFRRPLTAFSLGLLMSAGLAGSGCAVKASDALTDDEGDVDQTGLEGRWVGYRLEGASLSGSDVVVLEVLEVDDAGDFAAALRLGEGELLPRPTDPEVGYPPGATTQDPLLAFYENFEYPAQGTFSEDVSRVQGHADPLDLYDGWCEIQTSYATGGDPETYSCLPNCGGSIADAGEYCELQCEDGTNQPVDCRKFDLCLIGGLCDCDASGCRERHIGDDENYEGRAFDLVLDGDELTGTIDTVGEVRLVRMD